MKIVLASNNRGKLAELQAMLAPLDVELVRQADLGIPEAEEPHRTFVENALEKARHAARAADQLDDEIDVGRGRQSHRILLPAQAENRRAAMVSTLVAVRSADDPEPLIAVGRVVGEIAREPVGNNGFGFDPVMFIPEFGQTFEQLPVEVKKAHSHRGKAARAMLELIRERWLST